jgi:beta-galactosidase
MPALLRIIGGLVAAATVAHSCVASQPPSGMPLVESEVRKSLSLDGEWTFALDPQDVGEKENWHGPDKALTERIGVPVCWQGQGVGNPRGCVRHHYEGAAWYKKQVSIPADWKGKTIWLKIGGAARRTKAYVNGRMVGSHDGFLTPFRFEISGAAIAGTENLIALRVDNSGGGPVGCFNYLGNWGGIYRSVEVEAAGSAWIDDVFVMPDMDNRQAKVRIALGGLEKLADSRVKVKVRILPPDARMADNFVAERVVSNPHLAGTLFLDDTAIAISDIKQWSPETPLLYTAEVALSDGSGILDVQRVRFGMRKIDWSGGPLKINGRPYFLRGYGDDNIEVLTGLPPAKKDFFAKRLALTKSMGFNNVRFHSNVPFEECFEAADEAGMLIQIELPAVYINQFLPNENLLWCELLRIVKCYRNHPSYFSLALGNEFWLGDIDRMSVPQKRAFLDAIRKFYSAAKTMDPTRPVLSNDGDPKLLPTDIHSGAWLTNDRPFICHEYGGYRGSLPDVQSREEFTGLFAPYQGVVEQAKWVEQHFSPGDYSTVLKNSQRLFEIGRKNLLETARKNPQIDGYNYWLITDFPGGVEGDAWYYGVFDQFWKPKQATPESMRKVNSATVLLLDAESGDRCIWADRARTYKILVSHFGPEPIQEGVLSWRLTSDDRTLLTGRQSGIAANVGQIKEIAAAKLGSLDLKRGESLELVVELKEPHGTHGNSWTIWAFPHPTAKRMKETIACQRQLAAALAGYGFIKTFKATDRPDVLIASQLDDDARRYIREGGKLVLFPKKSSLAGQHDFPLFSSQMGVGPGTVIRRGGVMGRFPHGGFCEEQFLSLMQTGTAVNVDALPRGVSPDAWGVLPVRKDPIDLFHVAMVFSGRLGKGKILVCSFDVLGNLNDKHPEASCLLQAVLEHAVSKTFEPEVELENWIATGRTKTVESKP